MSECICSSCKNLKSIIDENDMDKNGIAEEYECEYGSPSEKCSDCEEDTCELTCDNYISDCEEEKIIISKCIKCGKELKIVSGNNEDGEVYCVTCYLNK
jgi:hypothetical protein